MQDRVCLLGLIADGRVVLNAAGEMVQEVWVGLPTRFPSLSLDMHVIMPNHMHGLIVIGEDDQTSARNARRVGTRPTPTRRSSWEVRAAVTLGDVVGAFKSITTLNYIRGVRDHGWPTFRLRLWQRNEHIIRNDDQLDRARRYIHENPLRWNEDPEYL